MIVLWGYETLRLRGVAVAVPAVLAVIAVLACGCGSESSDAAQPRRFAVLSAFPGELAPHLERAAIRETTVIEGRVFRVGVLDGVPVVLALTGIGLVNAATTTRLLLERFEVDGIVVSAVAGGNLIPIGTVAVPTTWVTTDGASYLTHRDWLAVAAEIAADSNVPLERCALVPSASEEPVCVLEEPSIVVGGIGRSSDPFFGQAFRCRIGGDDVYGCDVALLPTPRPAAVRRVKAPLASADTETPVVDDMETAAIASEAAARGVPFIAFRAASDGPGDPLGLPDFLAQFNAYYRLAARNAAAATVAFLRRVASA